MPSSLRRRLTIEGDVSKSALNDIFSRISERLDKLEGKSGSSTSTDPRIITGAKGSNLLVGNMSINRYGDDSEKVALAAGAKMDTAGQWIALQTKATIIEMDTTQNIKYYYDSGLTPLVPYTPTLRLTTAL